jgi:hypothetical protein
MLFDGKTDVNEYGDDLILKKVVAITALDFGGEKSTAVFSEAVKVFGTMLMLFELAENSNFFFLTSRSSRNAQCELFAHNNFGGRHACGRHRKAQCPSPPEPSSLQRSPTEIVRLQFANLV